MNSQCSDIGFYGMILFPYFLSLLLSRRSSWINFMLCLIFWLLSFCLCSIFNSWKFYFVSQMFEHLVPDLSMQYWQGISFPRIVSWFFTTWALLLLLLFYFYQSLAFFLNLVSHWGPPIYIPSVFISPNNMFLVFCWNEGEAVM